RRMRPWGGGPRVSPRSVHPPHQAADARQQESWFDRLHHVVVRTQLEADGLIHFGFAGGQDENAVRVALACLAADLEASSAGQHQIEDDDSRVFAPDALNCPIAMTL